MRKLTSHLFISLDGVVEAPDRFLRDDLYQDLSLFDEETVTGPPTSPPGPSVDPVGGGPRRGERRHSGFERQWLTW